MMHELEIKRGTAKHKAELIRQIYTGEASMGAVAREYDRTPSETERWIIDVKAGIENALKATPRYLVKQY